MDPIGIIVKLQRLLDRMAGQDLEQRRVTWRKVEVALDALRRAEGINEDGAVLQRLVEVEVAAEELAGAASTPSARADAARLLDARRALADVEAQLEVVQI